MSGKTLEDCVLDLNGDCLGCKEKIPNKGVLQCADCNKNFHGTCFLLINTDQAPGSISFVNSFKANPVKSNFKWFCDPCNILFDTRKKTNIVDAVTSLVKKVDELQTNVADLKTARTTPTAGALGTPNGNIWSDTDKVNNLRSSFIVKPKPGEQKMPKEDLRKVILENNFQVSSVGESSKGNYFVHCPSLETSTKLQEKLTDLGTHVVHSLADKEPTISLVGITEPFNEKNELKTRILDLNPTVKALNDQGNTFEILFMRAPNGTYTNYQVVARVSPKIREAIRANWNRVYIGCESVRVYDRFFVKRCNKCNEFGHFIKDCQKPKGNCGICGDVSGDHESKDCLKKESKTVTDFNCVNCKKAPGNLNFKGHKASSNECAVYKQAVKRERGLIPYYDSLKNRMGPPLY